MHHIFIRNMKSERWWVSHMQHVRISKHSHIVGRIFPFQNKLIAFFFFWYENVKNECLEWEPYECRKKRLSAYVRTTLLSMFLSSSFFFKVEYGSYVLIVCVDVPRSCYTISPAKGYVTAAVYISHFAVICNSFY